MRETDRSDGAGTCERCGAVGLWNGQCPKCLLSGIVGDTGDGAPESAPARLGRYLLKEEIGRGGMGRVWRARQEDLDRDVALKLLRYGALADDSSRRRFIREAKAAGRLRHPGIVGVYDVGEDHGELYIAMEWVRGETLSERLRSGPMDPLKAARLAWDVADALAHAHDSGVIHLDLKPGNILLDSDRNDAPRLVDFGIAKIVGNSELSESLTREGLGTLSYLAPEQLLESSATPRPTADIYGLGAVLYHCLTGRPPFVGNGLGALVHAVAHDEPTKISELRTDVPESLATLCSRCLAKRPEARVQSAIEVREALGKILKTAGMSGIEEIARSANGSGGYRNGPGWRKTWIAVAGLAGVGLATALLWRQADVPKSATPEVVTLPRSPLSDLVDNWPPRQAAASGSVTLRWGACSALEVSPCGRWVAGGDQGGGIRVYRVRSGELKGAMRRDGVVRFLQWSQNGEWLLTGTETGRWWFWHPSRDRSPVAEGTLSSMANVGAVNSNGTRFFVAHSDRGELWSCVEGSAERRVERRFATEVTIAMFNREGDRLLVVLADGSASLWDAATGEVKREFTSAESDVAAFTPEGRELGVIRTSDSGDSQLVFFRAGDATQPVRAFEVLRDAARIEFSPEGGRVAVANRAREVRFYDCVTGSEVGPALTLGADPYRMQFSADGLRFFVNSQDARAHVWDSESGRLIAGPFPIPWLGWGARLAGDGVTVYTPEPDHRMQYWEGRPAVPPQWVTTAEAAKALKADKSYGALRIAAGLAPSDPEPLIELARLMERETSPAKVSEREFLKARANLLQAARDAARQSVGTTNR